MSTIKATTAKTSADGTAHSPGIGRGDWLTKRIVRAKPYTKAETIRSIRITTPLENLFKFVFWRVFNNTLPDRTVTTNWIPTSTMVSPTPERPMPKMLSADIVKLSTRNQVTKILQKKSSAQFVRGKMQMIKQTAKQIAAQIP